MDAYIIDACRTPRGRRNGGLAGVHPIDLSTVAMNAIVERTGVDPTRIDDAILGCVTETGEQGACVARAAVLAAGWPIDIPGISLNRFCGSGHGRVASRRAAATPKPSHRSGEAQIETSVLGVPVPVTPPASGT